MDACFEVSWSERQVGWITSKEALGYCFRFESKHWSKFLDTTGDSIDRVNAVTAHVSHLLFLRGPYNILRAIALRVVQSFKTLSRWTVSHVLKKVLKTHPPVANRNSPTPVVLEMRLVRVGASLNHSAPKLVNLSLAHSVVGTRLSFASPVRIFSLRHNAYFRSVLFSAGQAGCYQSVQYDSPKSQ